jgi:ubiquinone biosynthesis protein COQ9
MTNDKIVIKNYLTDRDPYTKKGTCKHIYVNSALLDSIDKNDYFKDSDSDSDENMVVID